jgi:hypothetical protein
MYLSLPITNYYLWRAALYRLFSMQTFKIKVELEFQQEQRGNCAPLTHSRPQSLAASERALGRNARLPAQPQPPGQKGRGRLHAVTRSRRRPSPPPPATGAVRLLRCLQHLSCHGLPGPGDTDIRTPYDPCQCSLGTRRLCLSRASSRLLWLALLYPAV